MGAYKAIVFLLGNAPVRSAWIRVYVVLSLKQQMGMLSLRSRQTHRAILAVL